MTCMCGWFIDDMCGWFIDDMCGWFIDYMCGWFIDDMCGWYDWNKRYALSDGRAMPVSNTLIRT